MTRRANLRLLNLEERIAPTANRLFAMSQDSGRQVAVYLSTGSTTEPNPTYGGTGLLLTAFDAYAAPFNGGVHVALGDVTGDSIEDLITAPASNGGPHIKVFDGASLMNGNVVLVREFFAFDASFTGGEYLAVGQVNPATPGKEIIVGAGFGGGPDVRIYGLTAGGVSMFSEFFAFQPDFRGGVRVAAADVNRDGYGDVITAAGPGGGPHVRIFSAGLPRQIVDEFFAYSPIFRGGVYVTASEFDGDPTFPEIVTGAGEGGGPHVRLWQRTFGTRYTSSVQIMVGDSTSGARVGAANLGLLNGRESLYVGSANGIPFNTQSLTPEPRLRAFNLNWVLNVPNSTVVVNPIVPSTLQFVPHNLNFIDTFVFTRSGGLDISP